MKLFASNGIALRIALLALVGCTLFSGCHSGSPKKKNPSGLVLAPSQLASIAMRTPDGAIIVLADRSTWIVDPDHRAEALRWQRSDLVEALTHSAAGAIPESEDSSEFPGVLRNQEMGTSVRVRKGADFEG